MKKRIGLPLLLLPLLGMILEISRPTARSVHAQDAGQRRDEGGDEGSRSEGAADAAAGADAVNPVAKVAADLEVERAVAGLAAAKVEAALVAVKAADDSEVVRAAEGVCAVPVAKAIANVAAVAAKTVKARATIACRGPMAPGIQTTPIAIRSGHQAAAPISAWTTTSNAWSRNATKTAT